MFYFQNLFVYGLLVNIIDLPYDNGANMRGSRNAYNILRKDLDMNKKIKINKVYNMDANKKHLYFEFKNASLKCQESLENGCLPFLIGGDHTCAISSIFASNDYSLLNKEKLGIIWLDAHADFNTMESSPSKNLHGMPISILCGHTLTILKMGNFLDPSQFLYYGVRDIDSIELDRFQEYNMNILDVPEDLYSWCSYYDKIHISFDLDSLDPSLFNSVNTPVENGLTMKNIEFLFNYIKKTGKLQSLDLVEYNPEKGVNNNIIMDLIENLF